MSSQAMREQLLDGDSPIKITSEFFQRNTESTGQRSANPKRACFVSLVFELADVGLVEFFGSRGQGGLRQADP